MTPTKTLIVAAMLVIPPWVVDMWAKPDKETVDPFAYRQWSHVKTGSGPRSGYLSTASRDNPQARGRVAATCR